jgi:hypothetical protein
MSRSLFNSSIAVYDPYKNEIVNIITIPGITLNPALHIGGVAVDPYTGLVSIIVDAANPFVTRGRDVSGDNFLVKYDPSKKEVLWKLNITAVSDGKYGGFQDVEHDARGNTYVVGTFPGTILRVDQEGKAIVPWYMPEQINTTRMGYGGLAAAGEVLLANDNNSSQIHRFDMKADKGTPVLVPRTAETTMGGTDAIYLPPLYGGRVLLVSENSKGITVLRSKDGNWQTAEHLGTVLTNSTAAQGGTPTAALQIGNSLYMVIEFFSDPVISGMVSGNRTQFPLVDITAQVKNLLGE